MLNYNLCFVNLFFPLNLAESVKQIDAAPNQWPSTLQNALMFEPSGMAPPPPRRPKQKQKAIDSGDFQQDF